MKIKRFGISIFSYVFVALAVTFMVKSNVGKLVYNVIPLALKDIFIKLNLKSLTIGQVFIMTDVITALIAWILCKRKESPISAIIMAFIFGFLVDFWYWILPLPYEFTNVIPYWTRILIMISSVFFMAIWIPLIVRSKIVVTAIDYLIIVIAQIFNITFPKALFRTQFVILGIGVALSFAGGNLTHISIVGVILSITLGYFTAFWSPIMNKIYDKLIK